MVNVADPLSRDSTISYFRTLMNQNANALIVWHTGSNPFLGNVPSGSLTSTSYGSTTTPPLGGAATISSGPVSSDLNPDPAAFATDILNVMKNYWVLYTKARKTRLVKYYNNNGSQNIFYDSTQIAHLSQAYAQAYPSSYAPANWATNEKLSLGKLNQISNDLTFYQAAWRDTVVTFTENWCHSSCHDDHSARSRR